VPGQEAQHRERVDHHRPAAVVEITKIGGGGRKGDSPWELPEDSRCAEKKRALGSKCIFSSGVIQNLR
jgi:hypothetical protein